MLKMSLSQVPQMQIKTPGEKPQAKFNMRKLPMWSALYNSEINFEWPTEEIVSEFPQDIKLASLQLFAIGNSIV